MTAVKKFVIMTNKKPAKSESDKTVKSKADRRATKGRPYDSSSIVGDGALDVPLTPAPIFSIKWI